MNDDELRELNRIVSAFLDIGEDMAASRTPMTMADREGRVDEYLRLLRRDVLSHGGKVSRAQADAIAHRRYEEFDEARRESERLAAEAEAERDLRAIELEAVRLAKAARRK